MAEWLKAHAWKACIRETVSWVRIPLPPPGRLRNPFSGRSQRRLEARILASWALNLWTPTAVGKAERSLSDCFSLRLCTFAPRYGFADLDKIVVFYDAQFGQFRNTLPWATDKTTGYFSVRNLARSANLNSSRIAPGGFGRESSEFARAPALIGRQLCPNVTQMLVNGRRSGKRWASSPSASASFEITNQPGRT
jgi:hypothetical protein